MFELKITIISKSESLLGVMFEQGEYQLDENWIPFTRMRVGIIFITFDLTWFSKK